MNNATHKLKIHSLSDAHATCSCGGWNLSYTGCARREHVESEHALHIQNTEPKHTPGPWNYQALAGKHDFAVYADADGKNLALVCGFYEANARLIAAAPDLLAACRRLVTGHAENSEAIISQAHAMARAAIAAAEGKV